MFDVIVGGFPQGACGTFKIEQVVDKLKGEPAAQPVLSMCVCMCVRACACDVSRGGTVQWPYFPDALEMIQSGISREPIQPTNAT